MCPLFRRFTVINKCVCVHITDGSSKHARPWRQARPAVPDHDSRSEQDVHLPGGQQGVERDVGQGDQETAAGTVQPHER